jgi:hypothetical protein
VAGKKLPIIVDVTDKHYEVIIVIGLVVHLYTCSNKDCQIKGKGRKRLISGELDNN